MAKSQSISYLKIELFSPCALNMHIFSEFYLLFYCLLSSANFSFVLQIELVFTPLNCLVSSTTIVILLLNLNKRAEEHKPDHSSTELPLETYQPLFHVFSPAIHVQSFDLSLDTLGLLKSLYQGTLLNGFRKSRKTWSLTELLISFGKVYLTSPCVSQFPV